MTPTALPKAHKRPTPEQLKLIAENYKEMRAKVKRSGQLVLELCRHPDVTPEQITEVIASYKRTWAGMRSVHESCRQLNVPYSYKGYPWETPL